jgi:FdhD protein
MISIDPKGIMAKSENDAEYPGSLNDHRRDLDLPEEQIVKIVVSNGVSVHLVCSPYDLPDLAAGWLYGQEMIDCIDDIESLQICDENIKILAQIRPNIRFDPRAFQQVLTSGCAGGTTALEQYHADARRCDSTMTVTLATLRRLISEMFGVLRQRCSGGGQHSAALALGDGGGLISIACDIGRHNAVDKAIGMGLRLRADFGKMVLATSGRISSEMMLKAIRAGIPIVASPRSATSLAAKLAEAASITLCCRISRQAPLILGQANRIAT